MVEISGTPWEIEALARLLRGPKAAPVMVDYCPGNMTRYRLLIVPCDVIYQLTESREATPSALFVSWLEHGHFYVSRRHYPHDMYFSARVSEGDQIVLRTFFSQILTAQEEHVSPHPVSGLPAASEGAQDSE